MKLKPVNRHLGSVTIKDIENHKIISTRELQKDLENLRKFEATQNKNNFYGNPFLYHFQFKNLLNCRREKGKTIYDIWNDTKERKKLIENTRKRNRGGRTAAGNVYECFRINLGSIVMFKSTTAKYLYKKYGASHVLDPTAGWGGRMLGAWALDIDYTGIDTNLELQPAYDGMIDFLNKELFYKDFFLPLFEKCLKHIKKGGNVCFNISPKMYEDALKHGLPECDSEENLLQQLGQQKGKKKQDKIYIWRK